MEKKLRVIEKLEIVRHHTIKALYRLEWDASCTSKEIGFSLSTTLKAIRRSIGFTRRRAGGGRVKKRVAMSTYMNVHFATTRSPLKWVHFLKEFGRTLYSHLVQEYTLYQSQAATVHNGIHPSIFQTGLSV